jgi:hydrogenase/urease accessory protein HupE
LPANCEPRGAAQARFDGQAYVAQWLTTCPDGLVGGEIGVPGLEATQTDVLVRYELEPGASQAMRLTPAQPAFVVPAAPGVVEILKSYVTLGVDHILTGFDHLLFVFALVLLIRDRWRLVGAITAFTVAHSLTLAAAVLGWVVVPVPPVEALIALSITFLAAELLRRDGTGRRLSERYPWTISFAFGLLHGLGFARALLDVGLPEGDVPLALLAFNLGVEIGQLLFIGVVLAAMMLSPTAAPSTSGPARFTPALATTATAYVIGGISAYWFVARLAAF